jgi:hypothetical protein
VIYRRKKYQGEFAKKELISLVWLCDESPKREKIKVGPTTFCFLLTIAKKD